MGIFLKGLKINLFRGIHKGKSCFLERKKPHAAARRIRGDRNEKIYAVFRCVRCAAA